MQCASCGENNPEAYQFCGTCGGALLAAPIVQSEPDDALAPPYWDQPAPAMAQQSASRRTRLTLIGIVAAGLVVCVCAVCLIGGAASWYMLNSPAPIASELLPANASDAGTPAISAASAPTPQRSVTPPPAATLPRLTLAPPVSTGFQKWSTAHALAVFRYVGLAADDPRPMTKEDYGQVPMAAAEAIRFFLPSLGGTKGGRVYTFATSADLEKVRKYYLSAKGTAAPPWIFVKDNILLQINGEMPSDEAVQYLSALNLLR